MSCEVRSIEVFDRNFKRLSKKHPSLREDLERLVGAIRKRPEQGTPIGHGCYKIRLAITSKAKGKSSGARVITYAAIKDDVVYLLTIYDKSEQASVSRKDLLALRRMIP